MALRHLAASAALILVPIFSPSIAAQTAITQQIDVVANDYAFTPLPTSIAAGPTIFTFANNGSVQHEMSIGRLRAGSTLEDLLKISREGGRLRDVMDRSVGILIAGAGKSPDGRLWVDLLPGATYVMICNLRDKPDSPPHTTLGMYTTFRPEARR
jgi:plastocyanin